MDNAINEQYAGKQANLNLDFDHLNTFASKVEPSLPNEKEHDDKETMDNFFDWEKLVSKYNLQNDPRYYGDTSISHTEMLDTIINFRDSIKSYRSDPRIFRGYNGINPEAHIKVNNFINYCLDTNELVRENPATFTKELSELLNKDCRYRVTKLYAIKYGTAVAEKVFNGEEDKKAIEYIKGRESILDNYKEYTTIPDSLKLYFHSQSDDLNKTKALCYIYNCMMLDSKNLGRNKDESINSLLKQYEYTSNDERTFRVMGMDAEYDTLTNDLRDTASAHQEELKEKFGVELDDFLYPNYSYSSQAWDMCAPYCEACEEASTRIAKLLGKKSAEKYGLTYDEKTKTVKVGEGVEHINKDFLYGANYISNYKENDDRYTVVMPKSLKAIHSDVFKYNSREYDYVGVARKDNIAHAGKIILTGDSLERIGTHAFLSADKLEIKNFDKQTHPMSLGVGALQNLYTFDEVFPEGTKLAFHSLDHSGMSLETLARNRALGIDYKIDESEKEGFSCTEISKAIKERDAFTEELKAKVQECAKNKTPLELNFHIPDHTEDDSHTSDIALRYGDNEAFGMPFSYAPVIAEAFEGINRSDIPSINLKIKGMPEHDEWWDKDSYNHIAVTELFPDGILQEIPLDVENNSDNPMVIYFSGNEKEISGKDIYACLGDVNDSCLPRKFEDCDKAHTAINLRGDSHIRRTCVVCKDIASSIVPLPATLNGREYTTEQEFTDRHYKDLENGTNDRDTCIPFDNVDSMADAVKAVDILVSEASDVNLYTCDSMFSPDKTDKIVSMINDAKATEINGHKASDLCPKRYEKAIEEMTSRLLTAIKKTQIELKANGEKEYDYER